MATEATRVPAEGEPATDLVEALDELAERAQRGEVSAQQFLEEVQLIDLEVQLRRGESPRRRYEHTQGIDPEDGSTPRQRLNLFWSLTRAQAENGRLISDEKVWAEFEDEIGAGSRSGAGMTEKGRVGMTGGVEWGVAAVLLTSRYPRQARV